MATERSMRMMLVDATELTERKQTTKAQEATYEQSKFAEKHGLLQQQYDAGKQQWQYRHQIEFQSKQKWYNELTC